MGHQVTVYTYNYPHIPHEYLDVLHVKELRCLFKFGNAPFLPGLMKLKHYDIVHLHYPFYFGSEMVYIISKLHRQKYIVTYHHDVINTGLLGLFSKAHALTLMRLVVRNAAAICVTSLDYAQHSLIRDIVEKKTMYVVEVPNGVDIRRFNPEVDGSEIKLRHCIKDEDLVLFVGTLDKPHYFKGLAYLLKSFAEINNTNTKLVVVGDGELKQYYIEMSNKLSISNKTIFAGGVSEKDLPKYYAACDVLVLPSVTMGEAFGIVLVEAMASGEAVIASNLPGVRTVVSHGVDGFLVEPGSIKDLSCKLQYLLDNENLRARFGSHGRKKVEQKYTWVRIARMLENVYREVLS
ncbi:Phosphatidyl-myo-inositol mannosyltransferase [subsurface metagenome]